MKDLIAHLAAVDPSHHATRAIFFLAGLAFSVWASLIPFLKVHTGADEATLGLMLLGIGGGSLCVMPLSGLLVSRFGCRRVLCTVIPLGLLCLPVLTVIDSVRGAVVFIALMGALLGTMDVTMNIQSVIVEKAAGRPLLSGFHACYSMGGIAGAGVMSLFLNCGLTPLTAILILLVIFAFVLLKSLPHCLCRSPEDQANIPKRKSAFPPLSVLFLGGLCAIIFLTEGCVLDWSAVYLREISAADPADASLGFAAFATLQTVGRLAGDRIITRFGRMATVLTSSLFCTAALGILATSVSQLSAFACCGLLGLATANIVPIFFWAAGNQKLMPVENAMSCVSTCGYAGLLLGPASIGFVAKAFSLPTAFVMVAFLTFLVACASLRFKEK